MNSEQFVNIRKLVPMVSVGMLFLTLCVLFAPLGIAHAHGGGIPQIANAPIGEYVISVWTDPEPMRVGTVHVTVGLAQDNAAVLNRDVRIKVASVEGNRPIEAQATHENSANKFLYEADLEVSRSGEYRFTVWVDDISDTVSFVDVVEGSSLMDNPIVIGGVIALVAVVALVGLRRGRDG